MRTFVCMKWGTKYPAEYVNILWSMVRRWTTGDFRLVCYTDDREGIRREVETYPLPPITLPDRVANLPWRKVSLWAPELDGLDTGQDALFLDLDVILTGDTADFFAYRPDASFCVIENWTQLGSGIGNTSCYRFRVGGHPYIYERFCCDPERILEAHRNSQTFISRTIAEKEFWPSEWCLSFKHSLLPRWPLNLLLPPDLPDSARVICFTGKPDVHDVLTGRWPAPWHKKWYKQIRSTPWVAEHWQDRARKPERPRMH